MASTSETGHNKNAANFSTAYQILLEMGNQYNPTNPDIQLQNLIPVQNALQTTINVLNTQKPIYTNAVADREVKIAPLSKLITRTLNSAKSLKISDTDKQNLESASDKIRGVQKTKKINPNTADDKEISTSQMSYDNRIANLKAFIKQLESHPEYQPNETELQIANLENYHTQLDNSSKLVNTSGFALITARKNRNEILYSNNTGVIQTIKNIKSYLKGLGEPAKPYLKALTKLKFSDLKK